MKPALEMSRAPDGYRDWSVIMRKVLRGSKHGIGGKLPMCAGTALWWSLSATIVYAQGLDFQVRPFVPQESTLIVIPTKEFAEAISEAIEAGGFGLEGGTKDLPPGIALESFATIGEMSSTIKGIDAPIYSEEARAELATEELIGTIEDGQDMAAVSPSGYVEVRDITEADAAWLQLDFSDAPLGGATVSVSSPDTGRRQTLDESTLRETGGTTVIFAGTTVRVEVQAPAGSNPPKLDELIENVIVGTSLIPTERTEEEFPDPTGTPEHSAPDEEARCGEDSRVVTTHKFVARITPTTCTAFLIEGGLGVSAGHCFRRNRELLKLEFNVPPSDIDGRQTQAAVEDTYGIVVDSIRCSDCQPDQQLPHGQDWAVFQLASNTETGKSAFETQGGFFTLSHVPEEQALSVYVLGYGRDDDPLEASFSLQSATGEYKGIDHQAANLVAIKHLADTEEGSSGAPVVLLNEAGEPSDRVIGVHTGGWCSSNASKPNMGTSFLNEELSGAIRLLSP